MSRFRRCHRLHPLLAACIVLAAMLARVAVPGGFMPMATADGRVVLAPCSGHIAVAPLTHHGHGAPHQPAQSADARCAFADLAVPLAGGDQPRLAGPAIAVAAPAVVVRDPGASPYPAAHQRPPLRGPPAAA